MAQKFEFELVFELPIGDHDPFELSDAIFEAGFEDAVIGTGNPRLLGVELDLEGDDAESVILSAARAIVKGLPKGSQLREIHPDLVSLSDVAEKLHIRRQALQKRKGMPLPSIGGLYRIDELANVLMTAGEPKKGRRAPRFDVTAGSGWFLAGLAARKINALLTIRHIDPVSIAVVRHDKSDESRIAV